MVILTCMSFYRSNGYDCLISIRQNHHVIGMEFSYLCFINLVIQSTGQLCILALYTNIANINIIW